MRSIFELGELGRGIARIEQVDSDVLVTRGGRRSTARQADHGPVILAKQPLDDVASDDAQRAHHHCLLHCHAPILRCMMRSSAESSRMARTTPW
jgi:hypothetical protein